MDEIGAAIAALRAVVSDPQVITQPEPLAEYETATFQTTQTILAVVSPASTEQLQEVVRIANRHRLALYPVSRGRNWGLGSRVPVADRSVVVDLGRMNRISAFDEALSYVTVEPGVTFRQLVDFLKERKSRLFLSVIGGPPDASVLGNTIERGDGLGPLGDRSQHCCAIEAVLPTGELIRTGLQMFGDRVIAQLSAAGVGPDLQGLLFQSNLAITTRMTLWLAPRPAHFQGFFFATRGRTRLDRVTGALRDLQQQGVLKPNSFALWNTHKLLASLTQYPRGPDGSAAPGPAALLAYLPAQLRQADFVGMGALYSASGLHALADRRQLRRALSGQVDAMVVVHRGSLRALPLLRRRIAHATGLPPTQLVEMLYSSSPFLGNPTEFSLASTYWRKRMPRPLDMHPDRDRCGLHWVCTAVPFVASHIHEHAGIVERIAHAHALEPNVSYMNTSARILKAFVVIAFDRDAGDEEQRARSCHDAMLDELTAAGYPPIRLGIQSMAAVAPKDASQVELVRRLKRLLDPNDVLAPGRYDFRSTWTLDPEARAADIATPSSA
jgi:4-cresol dehydrogenase (hydroxylating) flavoprotein subunit